MTGAAGGVGAMGFICVSLFRHNKTGRNSQELRPVGSSDEFSCVWTARVLPLLCIIAYSACRYALYTTPPDDLTSSANAALSVADVPPSLSE